MSRLLFAAARGARIEMLECPAIWVSTDRVPLDPFDTNYMHRRIHPDDEHLQYGPVSTAMLEFAETGKGPYTLMGLMALEAFYYEWVYPDAGENSDEYARMFALILAEALADEGL